MAYKKLNLKNNVDKWRAEHVAHIEEGIVANEAELANKQPKGDYALKSDVPDVSNLAKKTDIPDVSNFTTRDEVKDLIDAIEHPENDGANANMIALTTEEILNICKF